MREIRFGLTGDREQDNGKGEGRVWGCFTETLEARRSQNIQVSGFEFVRPLRGRLLGFHAQLGGHEVGRVLHLEVDLRFDSLHGAGLLQAKVRLQ